MKLYLCPVCEKSCKQDRETCDDFEFNKVEWVFDAYCPECSSNVPADPGMLMQDEYGAFCAVTDCNFEQDYKRSKYETT